LNKARLHILISFILTLFFFLFCSCITIYFLQTGTGEELNPFNLSTKMFPVGLLLCSFIICLLYYSIARVSSFISGRKKYLLIYLLPLILSIDFIWDLIQTLKMVRI